MFGTQGQTFVAINPAMFAEGFTGRMQQFMQEMRGLEPVCYTYQEYSSRPGHSPSVSQLPVSSVHAMHGTIVTPLLV